MRPSDKRTYERLPGDPDEKAIAALADAIRSAWTKRQKRSRLRVDYQATRFRVPMISTRDIGLSLPLNE